MFESLADAGLETAAVNFTAYRGRTRHHSSLPFLGDVLGPERFFFYNLFSSDRTAPRCRGAIVLRARSTPMRRQWVAGS